MTATAVRPDARTDTYWLNLTRIGIGLAIVGLVLEGLILLFGTLTPEGDYQHTADYGLAVSALPVGAGLFLTVLGFHRLQAGRDGKLGKAGVWVYGLCMAELIIQCMPSVVVGYDVEWGPLYPLCALGLLVGLALFAAGSWRVGLLPKWMLGVWPPLGLVGSFLGIGPIPLVFAVFLVVMAVVLPRRLRTWSVAGPASP